MAIQTYHVGQFGRVKRLTNFTLPWVDVSVQSSFPAYNHILHDVMTDPNNPNKVFVVGEQAAGSQGVLVSVDAGATWAAPAGTYIGAKIYYEVWAIDSTNIVVVGTTGRCAISNDGGLTFNLTTSFPTLSGAQESGATATCVHFITPLIGVVGVSYSDNRSYVFRTNDRGNSWSVLNGGVDLNTIISVLSPVAVYMSNDQLQVTIACQSAILRSVDGGNTFTVVYDFPFREGLHMTWLPRYDATTLWATGEGGKRLISTDAGATWTIQNLGTLPSIRTPRIYAAHYTTFTGGFFSQDNDLLVTADAGLTGAVTDSTGGIITAVWTQANPCYQITNCDTGQIIITDTNLAAYVGLVIQLLRRQGCWTVEIAEECINVIPVVLSMPTGPFPTCLECTGSCYELIDCSGTEPNIITNTDLSEELGNVIQIQGYEGICWTVNNADTCEDAVLVIMTESFADCQECLPHCYQLANCANNQETISVADDLSQYVGLVVQLEGDTRCWYVTEHTDPVICNCPIMLSTPIVKAFPDCSKCPPPYVPEITKPFVQPGFETRVCNTQDYLDAKCNFADALYNDVIRKRYGVRICCEEDVDNTWIKNEQADLAEMFDPTVCIPVIVPSTDCCPPCSVTSTLTIFNPTPCPAPEDVTSELVIPAPVCPPPEDVTAELFIT